MNASPSLSLARYPVATESFPTLAVREARPPDAPKPRLLDRVREALRTRHYSRRTEPAYVRWIRLFIRIKVPRRAVCPHPLSLDRM